MLDKDKPEIQRERISQIVKEVLADCEAVFDDKCFRSFVRFRIDHRTTGEIVVGPVSEHASVFADYSDERLRKFIEALAPYSVQRRHQVCGRSSSPGRSGGSIPSIKL